MGWGWKTSALLFIFLSDLNLHFPSPSRAVMILPAHVNSRSSMHKRVPLRVREFMPSLDVLDKGHVWSHCQTAFPSFEFAVFPSHSRISSQHCLVSHVLELHSFAKGREVSVGVGGVWTCDGGSQVGDTCLSLPPPETLSNTDTKPLQLLLWHWTVVAMTVVTSLKKAEQLARPVGVLLICAQIAL